MLGRVAFSPNIRDRLDYSCALFDASGRLLGQATHMPVHLGSMAYAMVDLVQSRSWAPGDMVVLNDPYRGGTHLPDVTFVAPIFVGDQIAGFSANRAHHVDIGADAPGSMPLSHDLSEEGILLAPVKIVHNDEWVAEVLEPILDRLNDRAASLGDFSAQVAANRLAAGRLRHLVEGMGLEHFQSSCAELQRYARQLARDSLARLPNGRFRFTDLMDDDGMGNTDIAIRVTIDIGEAEVQVDFSGTAEQVQGNLNCPLPVTAAAVFYVFRCLMPDHVPPCHGAMEDIHLVAPAGCLVNARPPAAVAAGNVETSTRIVDVVCGALATVVPERIGAAAQGTMNNLAMGVRGDSGWDYYETIAGGHGASAGANGRHARHSHMTNTLNTPVEVLELNYPLWVEAYALRPASGGRGRFNGGDGVVRSYRFLSDADVTILSERRRHAPWGLEGGEAGARGNNRLDGQDIGGKFHSRVRAGQLLQVFTPGGGGYGSPET